MSRILAFIENDMYLRNFITSGAFGQLMEDPEFQFCLSEIAVQLRENIPADKIAADYVRNDNNRGLTYQINKVTMLAMREKSSTFEFKVRAGSFGAYTLDDALLASTNDIKLTMEFFTRRFQVNETLERIVSEHRPQVVIFPITGVESTGTELIMLSRKYGFKTFFLVNGWDNLSSKGILPIVPDFLGAWGPQSMLDAVNIQRIPAYRIILMGCARYEPYFKKDNPSGSPFPHKYILFAGNTIANDEITPLRLLDEALAESGTENVKIVYRPHPWREKRQCFDVFEPDKYRNVILDPQIAANYYNEKRSGTESVSSQNFPALDYYPSLVNNALFIISPMSSMLLEAALFDVPGMVLAHDDGIHALCAKHLSQFQHFHGASEVPGWFFARNLEDIKPLFKGMLQNFVEETPDRRAFRPALSSAMRYYLYHDERTYSQRLKDAVQMIQAGVGQAPSSQA